MVNGDLCHELLLKSVKQELAFDEKKDYESWRKEIREKFITLTGLDLIPPNACEPNMRIVERVKKDGYERIRFEFESEIGATVPCYLLIPDTGKDKYPVAIMQQGHSTGFHNSIGEPKYEQDFGHENRYIALQAVKRGFITLAIENRGMGERKSTKPSREMGTMCKFISVTAFHLGRTLIGERVWDVSRAIDQLKNFPQCDLDKILISGNSGGGTLSYYAACYDERIKLSAPSCSFCSYKTSILDVMHCNCNYIPSAYRYFEMQDLAGLIAPRRLAIIAGEKDDIFPIEGVKDGYDTVKRIYKLNNCEDNCSLAITPDDHYWNVEIVWDAIMKQVEKMGWKL